MISKILSFSWGENNSPENLHRGYLHGFVMEFKDEADRKIYFDHPEHIRIANDILSLHWSTGFIQQLFSTISYDVLR